MIQIQGLPTYALHPTDQLLVLCTQPPQKQFAHLLWIADALTLLRHAEIVIDWPRLSTINLRAKLRQRLSTALTYLATGYDAQLPADVLALLASPQPFARKEPSAIWRFFFT